MSTDTNDTTDDSDEDLMVRASAEVELPDVTPHAYALIVAGLKELRKSPDCTEAMYHDTEELIEHLESSVGARNEQTAGEVLDQLDRLDPTPDVRPGGPDGE